MDFKRLGIACLCAIALPACGRSQRHTGAGTSAAPGGSNYSIAAPPAGIRTIARATELVEKYPSRGRAHAELGMAYYSAGRYKQAVRELVTAVELQPHYLPSRFYLGQTYIALGQPAKAASAFRAALALPESQNTAALLNLWLGNSLWDAGDFQRAGEAYHSVLRDDPHNGSALYGLGVLSAHAGHAEMAREYLHRALAYAPHQHALAKTYAALGVLDEQSGDFGRARAEYEAALKSDPTNGEANSGLRRIESKAQTSFLHL